MDKGKKKRSILIRLSEDDFQMFKDKAASYRSVSAMVREAVAKHDDTATIGKLKALNDMAALHQMFQEDLSRVGGNLNQASKRANQLTLEHQLTSSFLEKVFHPHIMETLSLLRKIRKEQEKIVRTLVGL